jgi:hypothetical protein
MLCGSSYDDHSAVIAFLTGGLFESYNSTSSDDSYSRQLQAWKMEGSNPATKPKFTWFAINWRNPRFWWAPLHISKLLVAVIQLEIKNSSQKLIPCFSMFCC